MTANPSEVLKQRILYVLAYAGHKICFVSMWPAMQQSASKALSALEVEGLIEGHPDGDGRRLYSITFVQHHACRPRRADCESSVIARMLGLVHELRGQRTRLPVQQEGVGGILRAFLGVPCEFGEDCAYPGLGWRCGHRRSR